ncbi:hypothetical protein ACFQE1_01715 [Halobium palmae]|uniref:Uncharacterized protein n=1 Tax=Halobium palmae TaxID=1776492 RepID=A0ABD5RWJ5_9EURY
MWVADAFTVLGLIIDIVGAVLIIGTDWRMTQRLGDRLNSSLPRLREAVEYMKEDGAELRPGENDDRFELLFNAVYGDEDAPSLKPPVERHLIQQPEGSGSSVAFVYKGGDGGLGKRILNPGEVEEKAEQYAQRWYFETGVSWLISGFVLQIVATVLPYLLPGVGAVDAPV